MSRPHMVLETERLLLREMNADDFQALSQVLDDAETMWHYPFTFDGQHVRDWIKRNMNRYRKDGFGLWAVCLKENGELIGDCGLTLQNIHGEILPEIGYHIRHDRQRNGYAKEAARAVRDWAFRNTDYPALYSYCKYTNMPSIKTAESIGMHFVCEYPDETNGTTHVSAISRKEWLNDMRDYVLHHCCEPVFSPAIETETRQTADNTKRRLWNAEKHLENTGIGTKSGRFFKDSGRN